MDAFQDDDDEQDSEKKSKFKNSKKTGDVNKFKRDKNAPQIAKTDDAPKEVKVFKPVTKATLGSKWGNDDFDNEKQLANEKLKQLEEQLQQAPPVEVKKDKKPLFTGKANIGDKAKEYEEAEKEAQRLAQEKLKMLESNLNKKEVKVELVKDEPKEKKFTNSKKEVNNGLKKPKTDEKVSSEIQPVMQKAKVENTGRESNVAPKPQTTGVNVAPTNANKW